MDIQAQLGNYRILRTLGTGGFSTVYLGQHIYLNTLAAIKVLRVDSHLNHQDKEHFLAEARMVAQLQHPHIVRILEFGIERSVPFLIMEFASHGSLLTRYPAGSILSSKEILRYTQQIAQALQFAHDQHIVHCDVKPENILFNAQQELALSDFGIAITLHSNLSTREAMGTMYYMAPEQFRGKPVAASDQYALGIMLYNWLTGHLPFVGKTIQELHYLHTSLAPAKLRSLNPHIRPEIEQVVLRSLAKDPRQRFPTVEKFARALEQATLRKKMPENARALPINAHSHEISEPQRLLPSLASLLPSIASEQRDAAVPLLEPACSPADENLESTLVLPPLMQRILPPVEEEDEDAKTFPISSPGEKDAVEATLLHASSIPPDIRQSPEIAGSIDPLKEQTLSAQKSLLYSSSDLARLTHRLPEAPFCYLTYTQQDAWVSSVAWAPNGKMIASGAWDNSVHVWDAMRGKPIYIYEGHNQLVKSIAWSPDGSYLASGGWDNFVQIWEPATGTALPDGFQHDAQVETVAWSPNGKYIASAGHDGVILIWKATNKRLIQRYTGHEGPIWSVAWSPDGSSIASAGHDKTVQVWHFETGEHLYTFERHKDEVTSVGWSPHGDLLASGDREGMVYVWSLQHQRVRFQYHDGTGMVKTLAWSPNGNYLASGVKIAQIWDITHPHPVHPELVYEGHTNWINSLSWSPDGTKIATGSDDRTVQVWSTGPR